ncbi:MAG: DUF5615 family PIN-like protein [Anaerolineae bacterium]
MKFKIDENLPVEVADILMRAGHDALTVFDEALIGEIDGTIARVCQQEQRVLLTLDLDFADIRAYPPQHYTGIIIVRSKHQDKWSVMAMVARVVKALESEPITQALWIVDEQRIRIRE